MRDGVARKEISELRATIKFQQRDIWTLTQTLRLVEQALEELGLECLPAKSPRWQRKAQGR